MKKKKQQIELDSDDNIYSKEERKEQLEEDVINSTEAGFMEGYSDTKLIECNSCNKQFDFEKAIEKEINGTTYTFCSKKCADLFNKRKVHD